MSDYQRFVSYLYEYRDHKKLKNCGFSRVEVRDHQCKLEIHMKLPPCPFTPSFQVYAFVPEAGQLLGIPLGKAGYHQGTVYGMFSIPDRDIGGQPYTMEDLGGILIRTDDGQIFATAWKEISIQPEHFFLPETAPQVHAASLEEPTDEVPAPEPEAPEPEKQHPSEAPAPSLPAHTRWQEIQESYPHIQPFFDDEIHECVRLSLRDIPSLAEHSFYIGNNQFLSHGCRNFHHFLLGRMEKHPKEYVLAVPGVYDEKEQFLAAMFGFPNFKSARNKAVHPGQFGYWYRLIY